MSKKNPMKDPEIAARVGKQKRRPVIVGDHEYPSVIAASKETGSAVDTIECWCRKGINGNGELCRYKDSEQITPSDGRYNKGSCKPCIYHGTRYESPKDLAKELDVSVYVVYGWLRYGFDPYGASCRYADDLRE